MTLPAELSFIFFSLVEKAFNQWLSMDQDSLRKLEQLQGKTIAVELTDLKLKIVMLIENRRVRLLPDETAPTDTSISTDLATLSRMALHRDGSLGHGRMEISGDLDTGHRFKQILDQVDIDWEEQLSHVTGDLVAHQAGELVRKTLRWSRDTASSLGQDLSEYLVEEKRLLPHPYELKEFVSQVDRLRDDTERLAARLRRLQAIDGSGQT